MTRQERKAAMLAAYEAGEPVAVIAARLGVAKETVSGAAERAGFPRRPNASERMKRLNADPEFAAARDERGRERMKRLHASGALKSKVGRRPHWCSPEDLPRFRELCATMTREEARAVMTGSAS